MSSPDPLGDVEAVLFDVFGTLVDWRAGVVGELRAAGRAHGVEADWEAVADAWRGRYQPAMEEVRSGRRPWTILDVLHRESLDAVLAEHGAGGVPAAARDALALAWRRLPPWPDAPEGVARLRRRLIAGTLSNGNTALLVRLSRHAGLTWDALLGAETARAYKPLPEAYLRNVALLGLEPPRVMLVAAHNDDLAAAAALGLRTGFVRRPREHGPGQTADVEPEGDWDVVAGGIPGVARALGA